MMKEHRLHHFSAFVLIKLITKHVFLVQQNLNQHYDKNVRQQSRGCRELQTL